MLEAIQNIISENAKTIRETLKNLDLNKEVEDLTPDERFAIVFMAGANVDYKSEGDKSYFTTRNPIGIVKIDGKFQVYERVSRV
jgi:hypothetical protein